jgi:hypothetical protein
MRRGGRWAFGAGVRALFGVDVVLVCALSNVIIGLLFLLPVVGNERRRRLFFEGPREQERSDLEIGLLETVKTRGSRVVVRVTPLPISPTHCPDLPRF